MRELILANNHLLNLKDVSQLKNLTLLDVSYNRLLDFDKLHPLKLLKKLTVLSVQGNVFEGKAGHSYESEVKKVLPDLKVLDPMALKDFSQFEDMEHVCFP